MRNKIVLFEIVFLLIITICSSSYAFRLVTSPGIVKSEEEFNFDIDIDTKIYLANGQLKYDPTFLEFISVETDMLEIRENKKGEISWVYVESLENAQGINQLRFKFKAKGLATNVETSLVMNDSVYIDLNDTIYESENFSHTLKILAKDGLIIPATGSSKMIFYEGVGFLVMMSGVQIFRKRA